MASPSYHLRSKSQLQFFRALRFGVQSSAGEVRDVFGDLFLVLSYCVVRKLSVNLKVVQYINAANMQSGKFPSFLIFVLVCFDLVTVTGRG